MEYKERTVFENEIQALIAQECDEISAHLIDKNRTYGNSVLDPVRIFSKAKPNEQINTRLDDNEDPEFDLIGYLILKRINKKLELSKNEDPAS